MDTHADKLLASCSAVGADLIVVAIDMDHFKQVNDTLGHAVGDRLLKEVAGRLRRCLRGGDVLARFGGDEFVVLLPELPYEGYAAGVAARLLAALTDPLRLDEQECHVTASIGVATCPQDGRDAQTLQKHADTALHRAKDQGRNSFCHYSPQGDVHSRERLTLEAHLRRALARGELDLHYQPKQAIAGGAITGMEALLRWRHAELGMVAPVRFIPIAEETGLIVPIGEWVLRTACIHAAALRRDAGIEHPRVAVNLSARQFADQSLVPLVASVLTASGLQADCLELEITESLVMQNPEQAARLLAQLKEMGVQLAMDDFGTGYSSLAYLKRFPVDSIKIDRSFIQGLPGDEEDATITQAVIAMAHSLRLRTIAEGVETAEQLAFLERLGCDEIQGYYFSKPLPFGELQQFLAAHGWREAPVRSAPQIPVWP
jgi:diguanylate cyclase (GGDEF)-like protein